jgi:hypothetical protein
MDYAEHQIVSHFEARSREDGESAADNARHAMVN